MDQNRESTMQVVLCEPGKKARVTTIMSGLTSLQKMVDGGNLRRVH